MTDTPYDSTARRGGASSKNEYVSDRLADAFRSVFNKLGSDPTDPPSSPSKAHSNVTAQSYSTTRENGTIATELKVTYKGQTFLVTDPKMINSIQSAAEKGDFAYVADLIGPVVVKIENGLGPKFVSTLTPDGVPADMPIVTLEYGPTADGTDIIGATGKTVAGNGGSDYTFSFDHGDIIPDDGNWALADSVHYDVALDFSYPAPPVTGTVVSLPSGGSIEVDHGQSTFSAAEREALQNFDWADAGGRSIPQFEAKMRATLGDELTDKVMGIGVIKDGVRQETGLFGRLSRLHSDGPLFPAGGNVSLDGAAIGADINAVINVAPVPPVTVTLADGTQWQVDFKGVSLTEEEIAKIESFFSADLSDYTLLPVVQALREGLGDELVDKLLGIKTIGEDGSTNSLIDAIGIQNTEQTLAGVGYFGTNFAGFGSDLDTVIDAMSSSTATDESKRGLREIDGEVQGTTQEEREFDASSERTAVLWQGLTSITGNEVPKMSASDVFSYVAGVYLGTDVQFTDEKMAAFFEANIDSSGNLKSTLDFSMFDGIDPVALQNIFTDGAQLFNSIQANSADPTVDGRDITDTEAPALIFAASAEGAESAFVNVLQTEMQQTGTTAAASSNQWQDLMASGITSEDSVLQGSFTEDDLANDSLVKSILWVGTDVMAELQSKGLWNGPSAADLDSPTLAQDHALYDVVYTREGETFHVVASQEEFDTLVQQHKDGDIKLDTGNILSDYSSAPDEPEAGAEQYRLTYIDNSTGEVVVESDLSPAEHDSLVARHESGEIIILSPKIEDPNLVKLIWVEKALAVYDATQTPVYDAEGNVVSGGNSEARIAQAYVLYSEHNAGAVDTGAGTLLESLSPGGPSDTKSSKTDAEAIAFMNGKLGLTGSEPTDIYDLFSKVKGITDIVHVAGHWAQNRLGHPDHTAGEWLGGGNKDQANDTADKVKELLVSRNRTTDAVDAVLADTDREINQSRVLTGLTIAFDIVTLGADAAALSAAKVAAEEVGLEFTAEEGVSLLEKIRTAPPEASTNASLKAALFALVEDGVMTKDQAVQFLARQSGSDSAFWQNLGDSGAGYATAGAIGLDAYEAGQSSGYVPVSTTGDASPTFSDEGGLSMKEHLAAINLASQVYATRENVGIEAAGALLFGDNGQSSAVQEQALDLLPDDLKSEMIAYRDGFSDDGKLSSLIAAGDAAALSEYVQSLPSAAQQYDALVAINTSGSPELMVQVLQALPPEVAADILIYEQNLLLNNPQTVDGRPAGDLDTRGPLINAIFDRAYAQPENFKEDFGAIFEKVAEISPDLGAHILYTAFAFRREPDSSTRNADLAATILSTVSQEKQLVLLNSLDEIQVENGPRRELGNGPKGLYEITAMILVQMMMKTGDIILTYMHELGGDYHNGDLDETAFADYAASSPTAQAQINQVEEYIVNPFATFDDPANGAELGEFALAHHGYDKAAEILNDMPPEQAAAYLDQVSLSSFERLLAGMDLNSAQAALPFLASNQNIIQGEQRQQFIDQLADITGFEPEIIRGLFDGTITMDEMEETGAYNVVGTLYDMVQAGDVTAMGFINDAVDTLIAMGGSGDGDDPGGWDPNDIDTLEDLRDAATNTSAPSAEALAVLMSILTSGIGAAFQTVKEITDLNTIPPAVQEMGVEGLIEQNPEIAGLLENPEALQKEYLDNLGNTDEGRKLLESYDYQVIDGELYHAPRGLQDTTDNSSGQPSGASSSETSSSEPKKVSQAESDTFFQKHGRFDVAVEVTLFVGPGATARQFRMFVYFNGAKDEYGNMKFGLRLRQLTAVAPEANFSTIAKGISYVSNLNAFENRNWIDPERLTQLRSAVSYIGDVGNSALGVLQRYGLPVRGSVFAADIGLVGVKDFNFNLLGQTAKDDKGRNISGIQPEWDYRSSVSLATEASNAENAVGYQIANWLGNTANTGERFEGTDIRLNEVISYRHALNNFNGAQAATDAASNAVLDVIKNYSVLSRFYDEALTGYKNLSTASENSNDALNLFSGSVDRFQQTVIDEVSYDTLGNTEFVRLSDELNKAQATASAAVTKLDDARESLDQLIRGGHDPNSAYVRAAENEFDDLAIAAEASVEALHESLESFSNTVPPEFEPSEALVDVMDSMYDAQLDMKTKYTITDRETQVWGMNIQSYRTNFENTFENTSELPTESQSSFADLQSTLVQAKDILFARTEQWAQAQLVRHGLTAGVSAFGMLANKAKEVVGGNLDSEMGVGYGWGAVYNSGKTDPQTGIYEKDTNHLWKVAGEITVSAGGGHALNWMFQSLVMRTLDPEGTFKQLNQNVGGFNEFLAGLGGNDNPTQNQAGPLIGSYFASTVYSLAVGKYSDDVGYSTEAFGWAALQWRKKFADVDFASLGKYTGKAGGRFQVNFGQTLTTE